MKKYLLAIVLMFATGGAFASGGLSMDNVTSSTIVKQSKVEVERSELAHGPINKFKRFKGRMAIVDSEALQHGRNV